MANRDDGEWAWAARPGRGIQLGWFPPAEEQAEIARSMQHQAMRDRWEAETREMERQNPPGAELPESSGGAPVPDRPPGESFLASIFGRKGR